MRDLIDKSKRLEGLPRHASMHAAGVLISQKAVDEYVPLSVGSDGSVVRPVCYDNTGRTGTAQDGFSGTAYPYGNP